MELVALIIQCVAAIGTIAAASAAWYTARLNKQSSLRMENQAIQAEKDKHAAVKPIFYISSTFYKNPQKEIEFTISNDAYKIFNVQKVSWADNNQVSTSFQVFKKQNGEFIHKAVINFSNISLPSKGFLRFIYTDVYGKLINERSPEISLDERGNIPDSSGFMYKEFK